MKDKSSGIVEAIKSNFSVVLNMPMKEIPLLRPRLVKREGTEEEGLSVYL